MTRDEQTKIYLKDLVEKVKVRTRYDIFDNLVPDIVGKPTEDEIIAAIFDGVDDVNTSEPSTKYDLFDIMSNTDTRWQRALILASSRNFIRTLVFDWTANGFGPQIEDLQIENKLPDYNSLEEKLTGEFKELIEKLKIAEMKLVRSSFFATTPRSVVMGNQKYTKNTVRRYSKMTNVGYRR